MLNQTTNILFQRFERDIHQCIALRSQIQSLRSFMTSVWIFPNSKNSDLFLDHVHYIALHVTSNCIMCGQILHPT